MTATIETIAPVVMTTADGETRPAKMWGKDSYTCAFCDSPVFGPLDWNDHEAQNAAHYEKRGESYTWEPYGYRARYWEARECANPMCVSALTGEHLENYRESERKRVEREAARKAREQADADRKAEIERAKAEAKAAREAVRGQAELTGFAWTCYHVEREATEYSAREACSETGTDRAEYVAHMHGHGGPVRIAGPSKAPRLKRKAPAARLPKLDVNPFKWITWTERHTEPGVCECGHVASKHYGRALNDGRWKCSACGCQPDMLPEHTTQTAERRGQFWANGSRAHTVWVLPFEPAPWEEGRPSPVLLSVKDGRIEYAGWNFDARDTVRRAENVRARGAFAVVNTHNGPLRGYARSTLYTVHTDPECARVQGWKDSDHRPYDAWTVVDVVTGRSQGNGDTLCSKCVMLEPQEDADSETG